MGSDVLLVDDDQDVLESVQELIELVSKRRVCIAHGLAEVEQSSGRLASCGLAIVDINLGDGLPNGLDVLRWLRAHHFPGRVLFLTGHAASFPLVKEAATAGVETLSKPIGLDELRAVLERVP